jgi:hypothetical protein
VTVIPKTLHWLIIPPMMCFGCNEERDDADGGSGNAALPQPTDSDSGVAPPLPTPGGGFGEMGGEFIDSPDTGIACSGVSGTYSTRRYRDPQEPGSCPDSAFNPYFPIRVSRSAAGTAYNVEVGYARAGGDPNFSVCGAVNVAGCVVFATCRDGDDQVRFTVTGNAINGSVERTDSMNENCTINFAFDGERI